jgi:hypothetical protein
MAEPRWLCYIGIARLFFFLLCLNGVIGFPMGVNLSPLGGGSGSDDMGTEINWDTVSTYAFIDIFKHCTPLYIRSTGNNMQQINWQSNTAVMWRRDGYPKSLPWNNRNNYFAAICDIGKVLSYSRSRHQYIMTETILSVLICRIASFVYAHTRDLHCRQRQQLRR